MTTQSGPWATTFVDVLTTSLLDQHPAFRTFLRKRVDNDAVVEDLLQQSFLKALEQAHTLKKRESVVSWFYRILRNAVTDYYRSQSADHRKTEGLRQSLVATDEDKMPSIDDLRPSICSCVDLVLKELRPTYAALIERVDLKGESAAAVAKDWGLTANNLTVRLHRARQALRSRLQQACGICTKHGCLNCTCS